MAHIFCIPIHICKIFLPAFTVPEIEDERKISLKMISCLAAARASTFNTPRQIFFHEIRV